MPALLAVRFNTLPACKKALDARRQLSYCTMTVNQAMMFQIDFKSGKPVYLQLVDQVRYAAAAGSLRPGESLPSIRPLAEELRVNRNTIAKAYAELESQGIIETLPGKGCFLKENNSPFTRQVKNKLLLTEIDEAVVMAHHLQVDREKFLALVKERLDYFERKAKEGEAK
jgi:GntR family transcriptional regulator